MVSIVIPTHNRAAWLARAVDSVRAQTFRDWELVVVDDGSTDETAVWLKQLRDPRIHCLHIPHSGVSRARNVGVRHCSHPWISFLDSDDRWQPRKLQRQLEAMEQNPAYRVVYTDEIWIRDGVRVNARKKHRKYGGWIYRNCLPLCLISPSSVLLHCGVLGEVGGFDEGFPVCEDYELWLRLTARHPVFFLDEPLIVKVGGHADQLSRSRWGLDRFRLKALIGSWESGRLSPLQRMWTAQEIVSKATILSQGYSNRGKQRAARGYDTLARLWRTRAAESGGSRPLSPQ